VLNVSDRVGQGPFELRELEYVELIAGIAASAMRTIRNREARDDARDLVISALARLAEHRDSDTGRHVERVTQYSCILAESLRSAGKFTQTVDDDFIRNLSRAVPLHDIGKVAIPDRILLKPSALSLNEMAVMRRHVEIGADTLRPLIAKVPDADSLRMALDIIRAHHEWYDGAGYPEGLKGESIPLCARIVAVADVFDALTRDRVYKNAVSFDDARSIILGSSGRQFDPVVIEAFIASGERFRELAVQLCDDGRDTGKHECSQNSIVPASA
jgi:putative two-component system response regulator